MLRHFLIPATFFIFMKLLDGQNCNCRTIATIPDSCISEPLRSRLTGNKSPVTNPSPYIENTCIAGIQRYLARAVNMEDLAYLNEPGDCWGTTNHPVDTLNCQPPYDMCNGQFWCPRKYADNIQMLVKLNASFILRAGKVHGREVSFKPGDPLWTALHKLVCDINAAYDHAKLRRPIIQAAILEDPGDGVNSIPIPASVINAFKNKTGFDNTYYLNSDQTPKNINFSHSLMYTQYNPGEFHADIVQIEYRMWNYYQAITYLNAGYTGLHLGLIDYWGKKDKQSNGYDITYEYLQMIRNYATSIGSFVILNAENQMNDRRDNPISLYDLKYNNQLLFDFDGRSMRPRELTTPAVVGDFGCNTPYDATISLPTSCNTLPAIIDTCTIFSFGRNATGTSPLGCTYNQVPYSI